MLLCGQCQDKLSILSVTVAGSPSGTRPSPSSHGDVSVGQRVTESTNCNLSPLLIPSMKEKSGIERRTAPENQCLSWHHFMNGQGQFLGLSSVVEGDFT